MTSGTLMGLITLILLVLFVGVVVWAYSGRRRRAFEEAARLPLDDEQPAPPDPASGEPTFRPPDAQNPPEDAR